MLKRASQGAKHIRETRIVAKREDGFILLAVLFMLLLVVISLSLAAPKIATDMRRDKEAETIHRGMQYARAIRLYYRKFGRYPNTINQLINTDNQRFLRRRYLDPLTGKDDWRLIHLGQAGFEQNGAIPGTPAANMPGASSIGASGAVGSPFGSSGSSGPSSFGSNSSFGSGNGFGSSPSSGAGIGGSGLGGSNAGGGQPFGSASSTSATASPLGGSDTSGSSAFGSTGSTFGGAPIVGVGLSVKRASIKTFKKKTHYNEWEFVYDPSKDLGGAMGQTGAGVVEQQGGTNGMTGTTPGIGGSSGFGGDMDSSPAPSGPANPDGSSTPNPRQ